MRDIQFRKFLKNEVSQKVDGDYNMIYGLVRHRRIGNQTLEDYLMKKSKNKEFFEKMLNQRPLIQISIPIHLDQWDESQEILKTVVIGEDFNEKEFDFVNCFNSKNQTVNTLSLDKESNYPIMVISNNERSFVDDQGKIRLLNYPNVEKRYWPKLKQLSSGGGGSLSSSSPVVACNQSCNSGYFKTLSLK